MFLGAYNCSSDGNFKSDSLKWISQDADDMLKRSRLMAGDCIFCIVGNTIGSSFIVDKNILPANINQNVALIRAIKGVAHPRYMHYCLLSSYIQWQVKQEASIQAQPSLSLKQVSDFRITLPPIAEQLKITKIISTWDKAIATTEQLLANSQQQKKALMQQLLTGKKRFTGFSGKWESTHLCDMAKIVKGKALSSRDLVDGEIPVIAGGKSSPYKHCYYTHEDVITVSASGAYAGYVSYHPYKIWASDCSVVVAREGFDTGYIYQLLIFRQNEIYSLQSGGAQPHIYPKDLESLKVITPSLGEQKVISSLLVVCDKEIEIVLKQLHSLKQEKKALMQQLLTGKRRVKVDAA
ncbi:TPA: restriction endonuclease subunit S [Klebsiella quasipneumoniae subsp. quasipneumoniae]|nr:restriction endonuclease subunit S [Klebsiella quasipneumoniae subsp. quasipneumoniae]